MLMLKTLRGRFGRFLIEGGLLLFSSINELWLTSLLLSSDSLLSKMDNISTSGDSATFGDKGTEVP